MNNGDHVTSDRAAFEAEKSDLLQHHNGKFVLYHAKKRDGVFDTFLAAYAAGMDKFGSDPFSVFHVVDSEPTTSVPALTLGLIHAVV